MNVKLLSEENRKIYETQLLNRTGYTEERPGVKSSTRLAFLLGVVSVLAMAMFMCYKGTYTPVDIGIFLGSGFAALAGIKYVGTKNSETPVDK